MNTQEITMIQEDEIDLRELWQKIVKGRKIIALTTIVLVFFAFLYVLKLPNVYESKTTLMPMNSNSSGGLAKLGGLASLAGMNVGGGSMTPDVAFNTLLDDYNFMKTFVIKNKFDRYYLSSNRDKNYVFAFNFRALYDLFQSDKDDEKDFEQVIFDVVKEIRKHISISSDKKTGLISVACSDSDREFPPKIIKAFLNDASKYLIENHLKINNRKLIYFKKELRGAESFELRQSIANIISDVLKENVMMHSKRYYQCDLLTTATPAYIKDKIKPKRALILVVSFILGIVLGVFLLFFLEFVSLKKSPSDELTL